MWPDGHPGLDLPDSPARVHPDCGPFIRDYVLRWARYPESGGDFDLKTASLRLLPDALLLRALLRFRYSGLVFTREEAVIGHVFYQQHGDALHGFSIAVNAPFQGHGFAHVMAMDYIAYASQRDDIAAVRIGRGRNTFVRELLDLLGQHQERLGWRVRADGWIEFPRSR
jgi:hypothetical protein